ncbi:triosephosphate isomerase [Vallitalea pronyensis]|uniref:Triosephosphate isomerase n=1 Tax=Vallitalea pronyensis TaxID=1348613 RepID=A0A8J8SG63_9FIRM|nr:triose-phosphate isomerase family protein [Vallitalea pronyensis]QUI22271.1 triosephosphate isomerase [Vallitalea pronyensis]
MKYIFINLKRFDVSRAKGGICPQDDAVSWIHGVMEESLAYDLGKLEGIEVVYMLPESLLSTGMNVLTKAHTSDRKNLSIGSQSVYRKDIEPGGNFGAFTSNLPAAAVKSLGCTWSIIGHSEERQDKLEIMEQFEPTLRQHEASYQQAMASVNHLMSKEVACALKQNLHVLLCIGESAEEKGEGTWEEQKVNIKKVLKAQLLQCLRDNRHLLGDNKVVIGYEPIWAIGPGKTPPEKPYIAFVSDYIKTCAKEELGIDNIPVVYGGGLKEANANMIASIDTIDGGLVALTNFEQPIGFEVASLKKIIDQYQQV